MLVAFTKLNKSHRLVGKSIVWIVVQDLVDQYLCFPSALIVDEHIGADGIGIGGRIGRLWNAASFTDIALFILNSINRLCEI